MSYRIYEDIKAYVGPDGGAALVGLYHTNNGGVFLEKDGTRPGASELSVYVAESVEALRNHLMTKQFEQKLESAVRIEAETEGVFDCIVKGKHCEWGGLLKAQLDALSDPLMPDEYGELPDGRYGMDSLDKDEFCAVQLELICKMVADGSRKFFGRIRRSNAEVHPKRMRYDAVSPIRTLAEAKAFDQLFGYGAAVPFLTEGIRKDLDRLADYFGIRKGMERILFESEKFYLAADMGLLQENLDQIVNASNKLHTYPFIPDEIKAQFPMDYTAELLRDGVIEYADIPEEIRCDPEFADACSGVVTDEEMDYDRDSEEVEAREAIEENLVCLRELMDLYDNSEGVRLAVNPWIEGELSKTSEYELSLSASGKVFYFAVDAGAKDMRESLVSEMRDAAKEQPEPAIRGMLLQAAEGIETGSFERMDIGKGKKETEKREAESQEEVSDRYEDYYDYGLGL